MSLTNKIYGPVYAVTLSVFVYLFFFTYDGHVGYVGWEYVSNHWYVYAMGGLAGHCVFGMFYCMSWVIELVLR